MIRRRYLPLALVVSGIALCTFADTRPAYEPPFIDGYYVLAGDFHVHTAFGDGGLPPWDARVEAGRRGLDVIAVTNHNHLVASRVFRALFHSTALPLVIGGQEITAPNHHILAVGVSSVVDWNQPAAATVAAIQAQGGIAIAAHPGRESTAEYGAAALAGLDGAERAHPGMRLEGEEGRDRAIEYAEFFAAAREHNPHIAPIGDSDFHFTGNIGLCRTYLLAREMTERGVLDALRSGRAVAIDDEGNTYGDVALVEIADRARAARAAASPPRWTGHANAAGVALVWLGLIGLILIGRSGGG